MKPVYQSVISSIDGNCQAACIASILELSLAEIPNFFTRGEVHFWDEVQAFLAGRGLFLLQVEHPMEWCSHGASFSIKPMVGSVFIASVESQRFPGSSHAVIGTLFLEESGKASWRVVHDPNPDNAPYPENTKVRSFTFLVPMVYPLTWTAVEKVPPVGGAQP